MAQIRVENHGSLFLFRPLDHEAVELLNATAPDNALFHGAAMAVEHRYAADVAQALQEFGAEVL